ncbi:MAG: cupin domain-containing protein [Thermoleophilia bacterium]
MGRIHRQSGAASSPTWAWDDAPATEYRSDDAPGVIRHVLVGPEDGASDFVVRYFTVPAGAATALDRHPHEHGVVVVHGAGRVLLGDEWHDIGQGDSVFIAGEETHRLEAAPDQPLGFVCVIPSGIPG